MIITDEINILPKPNTDSNFSEYDSLMEESKKWAEEVGMKQSDIDDAVKSVRKEIRTRIAEAKNIDKILLR